MFEDLWPNKGDYDLNDLVIDCNWIEKYYNNQSIYVPPFYFFKKIFEIEARFLIRATGASYKISFGVQLPDLCYIDGTVTTDLPQGLQVEQDNNTIIFIFDVHEALGSPSGEWTNTDESMAYFDPVEFIVHIPVEYVNGFDPAWDDWKSDPDNPIYNPPYNPFIYVNDIRSHEIHLANYPPTDSMNTSLFGTGDDDSNPAAGIYYRTSNGLPWGVNISESTVHMKETIPIIDGFNHFAEWAQSGGTTYTDWYINKSGYIDWGNIYTEPSPK
ncbi:MAG: LruC domain-containing protein [Candidatus Cloacimonetes bacterium]|nr:LruC domain-containing protein [Candidatus Cloacimonadota bacterium]